MQLRTLAATTLVAAVLAGGCGSSPAPTLRIQLGETRPMGAGSIRSWVALSGDGAPAALGITLTDAALAAFPPAHDTTLMLLLPRAEAAAPFDHIELSWIARDSAASVFAPPRFDVRFYLITPREREAIGAAGGEAELPALELIPASYVPVAERIPGVGAHWIDPTAPEFRGAPFTASLLYGFDGRRLVFLEPRVARAFLDAHPDITRELKLPRRYARPGYYPTRYRVRYDARTREYSIALEALVRRGAPAAGGEP